MVVGRLEEAEWGTLGFSIRMGGRPEGPDGGGYPAGRTGGRLVLGGP